VVLWGLVLDIYIFLSRKQRRKEELVKLLLGKVLFYSDMSHVSVAVTNAGPFERTRGENNNASQEPMKNESKALFPRRIREEITEHVLGLSMA